MTLLILLYSTVMPTYFCAVRSTLTSYKVRRTLRRCSRSSTLLAAIRKIVDHECEVRRVRLVRVEARGVVGREVAVRSEEFVEALLSDESGLRETVEHLVAADEDAVPESRFQMQELFELVPLHNFVGELVVADEHVLLPLPEVAADVEVLEVGDAQEVVAFYGDDLFQKDFEPSRYQLPLHLLSPV